MTKGKKNELDRIKPIITKILKRHGIRKAALFGSYARGEQKKDSDIDILVELSKPLGFRFIGIQLELEQRLGKKVDLLTYQEISPYLKKYISAEEVPIL